MSQIDECISNRLYLIFNRKYIFLLHFETASPISFDGGLRLFVGFYGYFWLFLNNTFVCGGEDSSLKIITS